MGSGISCSSYHQSSNVYLVNDSYIHDLTITESKTIDSCLDIPPIRFINFEELKKCTSLPRYPEMKDITINIDQILDHRDKSLLIFISHCWLRGYPGAIDYDTKPHPDNIQNSKFTLIIAGIEKTMKNLAPGMEYCYIWLDFGCMDQDCNPAGELKQLDKIVQACDCIFTPIYDPNWDIWDFPNGMINNIYEDYKAKLWNDGDYAYINRGWCRVEMFYAANIPLLFSNDHRISKLVAGLKLHANNGIRPHLLYGDKEHNQIQPPKILPPIQNSYYQTLNPKEGKLSVISDMIHIDRLIDILKPYIVVQQEGYVSECIEGKGIYKYKNGDIYEGELDNGTLHGIGTYKYASGHIYTGEYKFNMRYGKGIFIYPSGDIYEGEWKNDTKHGKGCVKYACGNIYEGNYMNGKKHGKGIYQYSSGNIYEGHFENDKMHGFGIFKYSSGDSYEGMYAYDKRHGKGIYKYIDGSMSTTCYYDNGESVL